MEPKRSCTKCYYFAESGDVSFGYCCEDVDVVIKKDIAPMCPCYADRQEVHKSED